MLLLLLLYFFGIVITCLHRVPSILIKCFGTNEKQEVCKNCQARIFIAYYIFRPLEKFSLGN